MRYLYSALENYVLQFFTILQHNHFDFLSTFESSNGPQPLTSMIFLSRVGVFLLWGPAHLTCAEIYSEHVIINRQTTVKGTHKPKFWGFATGATNYHSGLEFPD